MTAAIRRTGPDALDLVAPLFHRYRVVHGQPDEGGRGRALVGQRLAAGDAVVLLAAPYPAAGWQAFGDTQWFRLPLAPA